MSPCSHLAPLEAFADRTAIASLELSHGILPEDLEEPAKITSGNASPESSVTLSLSDHPIGEEEAKNERVASSPVLRARLPLKVEEAQVGLPPDKEYRSRFTRFASYPLRRTRWLVPGILAALGIGAAFPLSGQFLLLEPPEPEWLRLTSVSDVFFPAWMLGQVLHAFSLPYADDISTKTKFWALMFTMVAIGTCLFSLIEAWFLINGAQKVTRQMRREGAHAVLRQVRCLHSLLYSLASTDFSALHRKLPGLKLPTTVQEL